MEKYRLARNQGKLLPLFVIVSRFRKNRTAECKSSKVAKHLNVYQEECVVRIG